MSLVPIRNGVFALILILVPLPPWTASAQVNLPPGFETIEIAVDDRFTGRPWMNNCGQIVYSKEENALPYGPEIYLYDNGKTYQVTHNEIPDDEPVINDAGDMAWIRYVPQTDTVQMVFLRDGVETVVAEDWSLGSPTINELGHLAWSRSIQGECYPTMAVIMFWDGQSITQITRNEEYYNQSPSLNDFDDIVWTHMDVCATPWTGRIQAYWGGRLVDLPSEDPQEQLPALNADRTVVWRAGTAVVIRRGESTDVVHPDASVPEINERGHVYATVWDGVRRQNQPWLFLIRDNRIRSYRLADSSVAFSSGSISDDNEVCCRWLNNPGQGDWGGGVLYLRRVRNGDLDSDGIVGLHDFRQFSRCLSGPGEIGHLCSCRASDLDWDDDVDLTDVATFLNSVSK